MASTRKWRKANQVRSAVDLATRQAIARLDEKQCCYMDENGVRCERDAFDLGYCSQHWGR